MPRPAAHRLVMASRAPDLDSEDFFPTGPWGGRAGAEIIKRLDPKAKSVGEFACGAGHLVHGFRDYFDVVRASDAYPYDGNVIHDFLGDADPPWAVDWVATNPPFADGKAEAFIRRAYKVARRGVAMLLRVGMLESAGRYPLHMTDCPLTVFAPFCERLPITKGRWEPDGNSAAFYAWFFYLKPVLRPRRFMARIGETYHPATLLIPPGTEARLTRESDARLFGAVDRAKAGSRR